MQEMTRSSLQTAIYFATEAVEEDKKRNYKEADRLYRESSEYFLHSIKYNCYGEERKEMIRAKVSGFLDRAEKLRKYLSKKSSQPEDDTDKNPLEPVVDKSPNIVQCGTYNNGQIIQNCYPESTGNYYSHSQEIILCKPVVVKSLNIVQCATYNNGQIIQNSSPAFENSYGRPPMTMPDYRRRSAESTGNYYSQSQDTICNNCHKMVIYQTVRVCDCGCFLPRASE